MDRKKRKRFESNTAITFKKEICDDDYNMVQHIDKDNASLKTAKRIKKEFKEEKSRKINESSAKKRKLENGGDEINIIKYEPTEICDDNYNKLQTEENKSYAKNSRRTGIKKEFKKEADEKISKCSDNKQKIETAASKISLIKYEPTSFGECSKNGDVIHKANQADRKVCCWKDFELVSEQQGIQLHVAKNVIKLFEDGCTIPFIARYRKDITNNMSPETLREVKERYDKVLALQARSQTVLKSLKLSGNLTSVLENSVLNAKSLEEVEHIYAPYKTAGKKTLVERAKKLGLEEPAQKLMNTNYFVDLKKIVDSNNPELDTYEKVEKGIVHIIAHIISTDIKILTFVRDMRSQTNFGLEVKKAVKRTKKTSEPSKNTVDATKFENYFDFKIASKYIKPHQMLAINRGEHQSILSVKVTIPDFVFKDFSNCCWKLCSPHIKSDSIKVRIFNEAIQDCFKRLIQPLMVRETRADLKAQAEKASFDVFRDNLKQLLLTAPVKGRPILGIDPGYANGCKIALISCSGILIEFTVLNIHNKRNTDCAEQLRDILQKHNCSLVALGNGTACRETEAWLSDLISNGYFRPLDVQYTIISENGASIYSCSDEAKKEYPKLDPNIISAVSLAKRIQEPLGEYVKVEPKHLGIGMYQHDLPKKQLEEALDCVVTECVSFVGVDLNTASQCLLRKVAGLSDKRATQVINFRETSGPFINRKQLMEIKGIGEKTFEQCAGFLKVGPLTVEDEANFYKKSKTNKLDCTIIHPESYDVALKLLGVFKLKVIDIGKDAFIKIISAKLKNCDYKKFAEDYNSTEENIRFILEALSKPLNYDLRNDCPKIPLFKKCLTSIYDLRVGTILTGSVNNNTHFGVFVDIGVGTNGLIHTSKMKGQNLQIGNMVEVKVINVDISKQRVGLEFINVV